MPAFKRHPTASQQSRHAVKQTIATVAVPVPLRRTFDFKVPPDQALRGPQLCVGARVQVPFGARELIGVIIQLKDHSDYPEHKLKSMIKTLDPEPVFDPLLWSVLQWISRYYIAPIGEVLDTALPQVLRKGNPLAPPVVRSWRLTEHGRSCPIEELERAPLQLAIVKRFMHREVLSPIDFKQGSSGWRQALASLVNKGWIEEQSSVPELKEAADTDPSQVSLNEQQRIVVQKLQPLLRADRFSTSLLHGVTGSGKTEVYFAAMRQVIKHGQQVLMLVPEIGLTPQLLQRVKTQLGCPMVTMHSGLNPRERHLAWWHARQGSAKMLEILVAEDNQVNQQVIEGILKHAGHRVRLAGSGELALDILARDVDKIDLVILDMNMPQKSGIEVVKALRFMDTSLSVPVIMLTADATPEAREASLTAGANSFLTKPVDARLLLEKVAVLTRNLKGKGKRQKINTLKSDSVTHLSSPGVFQASPWFDDAMLSELADLGEGLPFVERLVKGFAKDGARHINSILQSQDDDYPTYRESLHALKGSATELGAASLVKVCLKGESLKPYDMGTEHIKQLNSEVEEIFNLTVTALQNAVSTGSQHNPNKAD